MLVTAIHCFKEKIDASERRKYRRLKLTDQILRIVERVIQNTMRQEVHISEIEFHVSM